MLIRGGLIIPNGSTEPQINPYGIAGLTALVGMFAKQATDKLAEIFDTLFRSNKNQGRSEPLTPDGSAKQSRPEVPAANRELNVVEGGLRDEPGSVKIP